MNENQPTIAPHKAELAKSLKHLLEYREQEYTKSGKYNNYVAKAVFGPDSNFAQVYVGMDTDNFETEGDILDAIAMLTDPDNWIYNIEQFAFAMYQLHGFYDFARLHPDQDNLGDHSRAYKYMEEEFSSLAETMTIWVWN